MQPAPPWYLERSVFDGPELVSVPVVAWEVQLSGPVIHPLATDGQSIYAVANGEVTRLWLDGVVGWAERVEASGAVAPTLRGPAVGTESGLVAVFDAEQGRRIDDYDGGGPVRGRPVPIGGDLAWVTVSGLVVADAGWSVDKAFSTGGGASSDAETLYFSTLEGDLYAVGPEGVRWRVDLPGPGLGAPVVGDGTLFQCFSSLSGRGGGVVAVATADGSQQWIAPTTRDVAAPPALGQALLVPLQSGELIALDPGSGRTVWTGSGQAGFSATPAVVGRSAYVGNGDGRLHRFDLDDGGEAWVVDLGSAITGDPVAVAGMVFVGLADGRVVALAPPP